MSAPGEDVVDGVKFQPAGKLLTLKNNFNTVHCCSCSSSLILKFHLITEATQQLERQGSGSSHHALSDNESVPEDDAGEGGNANAEGGEAAVTDPWVDLDPSAEVVDLNHQKLACIDERVKQLKVVEVLTFRWNLLKKIENIDTLVTLKEVEFYDNQITKIENLEALVNLE